MEIKEKSEKKMFDEKVKEKSVNFTSKGRNQRKVIENKNVRKFFQTETKYQDCSFKICYRPIFELYE